jgi:hypothetical protein
MKQKTAGLGASCCVLFTNYYCDMQIKEVGSARIQREGDEPVLATLSPVATSGELAMKVWRHGQNFCNLSDTSIVKFRIKFSNFFN